jgi:transposase-like protein
MAMDQLTQRDNIVEIAKELGISQRLLYMWH